MARFISPSLGVAFLLLPVAALAQGSIPLMECINGNCSIAVDNSKPFSAFWGYFDELYPWIVGTAAGIALLWALISGIQIIVAGDSTKMEAGKTQLLHAALGLLLILFSAIILHILNPTFFQ
ncbi:hypothetical protein HY285_01740 [Candidatus Peregrinibacteria bacterium]|nr:hypothetical protein [Candidatus Peregrinibacteria bacterium]MBI3816249.1 hypothetical protein [Candidatus Peregrinibacteria bacterium]